MVVYLGWGVQLLNGAFFHHHHAIAHRHGFGLIMGDVNHGGSHFLVELAKFQTHLQSHLGVQVGEGLIKQKDFGSADERPSDSDPLALTPGALMRHALQEWGNMEHLGGLLHP